MFSLKISDDEDLLKYVMMLFKDLYITPHSILCNITSFLIKVFDMGYNRIINVLISEDLLQIMLDLLEPNRHNSLLGSLELLDKVLIAVNAIINFKDEYKTTLFELKLVDFVESIRDQTENIKTKDLCQFVLDVYLEDVDMYDQDDIYF